MKAVISGDWHIGANPRYVGHTEDIHRCIKFVSDYAIENKATVFIIAGDGLHRPMRISQEDLSFLESIFFNLGKHDISIYYMLGNHDSNRTPIIQTMWHRVYFESTSIKFIDRENYMEDGIISPFGYTTEIVLIPYLLKGDPLPEKTKPIHRIAILHQTIGGVQFKGNIHARDVSENSHERIFLKEDLDIVNANQYLSGHIHKRHGIDEGKHRVDYMGSTCIMTFGEIGVGNTFAVANYNGGKEIDITFHDIPQRKWLISKGIPSKIQSNSIYKLILTKEEATTFIQIKNSFSDVGSKVATIETIKDTRISDKRVGIDEFINLTEDERLVAWLTSVGIESPETYLNLDKEIRGEISP